ncbi:MAG: hypothetical protein ISS23_02055 [Nanoarchaeota archaeon]|nr:hypothetical protein [Nanoarchaeota archaeon]
MSLAWKLGYVLKLPREVSDETKDKVLVEVIGNHVRDTKMYEEKFRSLEKHGYSPYSPMLENVIKGETSFEQELKGFEEKYGVPKDINGAKLVEGSGWHQFMMEQGVLDVFGSFDLEENIELLDNQIGRLRPKLIEALYS